MKNRGQRNVKLRLGSPDGSAAGFKFQDAEVRRTIMAVGDSTAAGNCFWYDDEGSYILPRGTPELAEIRKLIQKVCKKFTMRKENNVYQLDAWVDVPEERFFKR